MVKIADISVVLSADTAKFSSGLNKARGDLQQFSGGLDGGVGRSLTKLVAGFATAGAAAAAFRTAITKAMEFEQTQTSFKVLLRDGEAAGKLIAKLRTFAASTPLELPEITNAARQLLAFGFAANEVESTLRRLGDISSLTGNSIGDIAYLYGTARVQGRLFAQDINQFTGRGVPIIQALAKTMGIADGEVKKLVEQGKVGFPQLEAAINSMTDKGGQFFGGMEEQSKTLAGQWSTLKDAVSDLAVSFGTQLVPALKQALPMLQLLVKLMGAVPQFFLAPNQLSAAVAEGKKRKQIASLQGEADQITLAARGRQMNAEELEVFTYLQRNIRRLTMEADALKAESQGRPYEAPAIDLPFYFEPDKFDPIKGRRRKGVSAKDLLAQGGIGERIGLDFARMAAPAFVKGLAANAVGENMVAASGLKGMFDVAKGERAKGEYQSTSAVLKGSAEANRIANLLKYGSSGKMDAVSVARAQLDEAKLHTAELKKVADKLNPAGVLERI